LHKLSISGIPIDLASLKQANELAIAIYPRQLRLNNVFQ
jgi:hypothetical protein